MNTNKKAIVLTYPDVGDEEKELLKNTDVFKVACNWHAAEYKPDVRIVLDKEDTIKKALEADNANIVSVNYKYPDKRVIYAPKMPNRNSTLPACVDYLVMNGYMYILLVATNKVTNGKDIAQNFQNYNKNSINELQKCAYIYKYSQDGVFDIPFMTIKEFLSMTDDELILGGTLPAAKKRLLDVVAFSEDAKYLVIPDGGVESIENGKLIETILPVEYKEKILSGETEIKWNRFTIKSLLDVEPVAEPELNYADAFVLLKEKGITPKSKKKADVFEAVKDIK